MEKTVAKDAEGATDTLEAVRESAAAREAWYRLLSSLYFAEIDQEGLDRMAEAVRQDAVDEGSLSEGFYDIAAYLKHRGKGTRQELAVDFASCMLAAGSYEERRPTPYESVFTSESGLLMQEARDDVYRLFCEARVGVDEALRMPEDHLSFECEFMAVKAHEQAHALERGDVAAALDALGAQEQFHRRHLLNWIDAYCDCLEACASTRFYRGVAKLTRGFVHADAAYIGDSIAALSERR